MVNQFDLSKILHDLFRKGATYPKKKMDATQLNWLPCRPVLSMMPVTDAYEMAVLSMYCKKYTMQIRGMM